MFFEIVNRSRIEEQKLHHLTEQGEREILRLKTDNLKRTAEALDEEARKRRERVKNLKKQRRDLISEMLNIKRQRGETREI